MNANSNWDSVLFCFFVVVIREVKKGETYICTWVSFLKKKGCAWCEVTIECLYTLYGPAPCELHWCRRSCHIVFESIDWTDTQTLTISASFNWLLVKQSVSGPPQKTLHLTSDTLLGSPRNGDTVELLCTSFWFSFLFCLSGSFICFCSCMSLPDLSVICAMINKSYFRSMLYVAIQNILTI